MSKGDFEYCGEENGLPVYRVRWGGAPRKRLGQARAGDADLSQDERRYALFVRYLIRHGRLGEGMGLPADDVR